MPMIKRADILSTIEKLRQEAKNYQFQISELSKQCQKPPVRVKTSSYVATNKEARAEINSKIQKLEEEKKYTENKIEVLNRLNESTKVQIVRDCSHSKISRLLVNINPKTRDQDIYIEDVDVNKLRKAGIKGLGFKDSVRNILTEDIFAYTELYNHTSKTIGILIKEFQPESRLSEENLLALTELITLKSLIIQAENGCLVLDKNNLPFIVIGKNGFMSDIFTILENKNNSTLIGEITKVIPQDLNTKKLHELSNKLAKNAATNLEVKVASAIGILSTLIQKAEQGKLSIPFENAVPKPLNDPIIMRIILPKLKEINFENAQKTVAKIIDEMSLEEFCSSKFDQLVRDKLNKEQYPENSLVVQELLLLEKLTQAKEMFRKIPPNYIDNLRLVGPKHDLCAEKIQKIFASSARKSKKRAPLNTVECNTTAPSPA